MSKYNTVEVWNRVFGNKTEVYDYAGRLMKSLHAEILKAVFIQRLTISDRFLKADAISWKTL